MSPLVNPIDYFAAFLGGIILSLTPCVYPLIPVTVGFIGIEAQGSKFKGLTLSLIYVTGIAITYSALGLLASLTGKVFGKISSHPITLILVGILIIVFGVLLLDLFKVHFPGLSRHLEVKKKGYFPAFILGLSSGLVISPCVTPMLGSILLYLAAKKNVIYGATLLLSFSYGMGLILVLAGTFSAILINLPKSGKWMLYIKNLSSFILILMGLYFIFSGLRRF